MMVVLSAATKRHSRDTAADSRREIQATPLLCCPINEYSVQHQ
jgi:hypothetical protein